MKTFRLFQYAASGFAGLGLILPSSIMAAQTSAAPPAARGAESPAIVDVALSEGGTLVGQLVDGQGAPLSQAPVTFRSAGTDVASTVTDANGSFSVGGLHGGLLEVNAGGGSSVLRVWTANASPPTANKAVLIVANDPVARGQFFKGPNKRGSIILFGVIVGGAVTAGVIAASIHHSGS